MDKGMIIEAIGYTGSALVLVSFLMVSVVKLRVVNTIGSIIFTVYAFIIHSYPTAIMNVFLVLINIYHLVKMSNTSKESREYDLVKVSPSDSMLRYTIERVSEDIMKVFPGISLDFSKANDSYIICYNGSPAGIFVGVKTDDNNIDILLDYSLPEFRDFSIGSFLFSKLKDFGVATVTYSGPVKHHKEYLARNNFTKTGSKYIKVL